MKKKSSSTQAFTLIEIMMAMAIFSLVMVAVYSTWMAIARGSQAAVKVAAQVQRERIAMSTIEQALTAARSFQVDLTHYSFVGENGNEATLSFVAKLPQSFPRSGRFGDFDVRRVVFALESGKDTDRQLVLRQCPIMMDFDQDEKEHPLVLAKDVKEMVFEFWDARLNDWTDEWTQTNLLPKMVKITLSLNQPNPNAPKEELMRIVALPSMTVAGNWQKPGGQNPPPPPPP